MQKNALIWTRNGDQGNGEAVMHGLPRQRSVDIGCVKAKKGEETR